MPLQEDFEDSFSDYNYDDFNEDGDIAKKNIKRRLEDRLEKKRLRAEFQDDFEELDGDFNWDEIDN